MKTIITKEDLIELYITQNKTDKEIGQLFFTSTFCIWQLRKKYNIKGINARHRKLVEHPQSSITSRQMEIILGSLLGDGCIKQSSYGKSPTASLTISHTYKHKEYVDWLYEELKSISPTTPKQYLSKGKYITYWFSSESRKDLKEIRQKIYVPTKRVNEWWIDKIGPLGLAIWFMDDGTLSYINKNKCNFSFATNCFTEEENYMLAKMLKNKFDLNTEIRPCNKKTGMQYNIFISDDSFDRFAEIVSPYMIGCMKYKIPGEHNRLHWRQNIECKIDKDTLNRLYNQELFTQEQIAKIFNVRKGTIRKYMDLFNIAPRDIILAQMNGKNNKCNRSNSGQFLPLQINEDQEKRAQDVFKEIKLAKFPYVPIKQENYYIGILDRLYSSNILANTNNIVDTYSRSGIDICSAYCPQIFSMAAEGSLSPIDIYNDDNMFMDCIRQTIKYTRNNSHAAIRQGLKTYRRNRCVTIFPPMWAKSIIKQYCNGGNLSVLDFSCGFGGRLIGCYASSLVNKYMGIDPLCENIDSNIKIYNIIKRHSDLKNIKFEAKFIKEPAEVALPLINDKFDIIITSPPYFTKEQYSKEITQCYIKYNNYNMWKEEWLNKTLIATYEKLNENGHMFIFASNYDKYNIGFDCRDILRYISKSEPLCVNFRLPSLEYFRSKNLKKYDTAWIVQKNNSPKDISLFS